MHTEKQEIFDKYAKEKGFKDWEALQFQYCTLLMTDDEFNLFMFEACDLVQAEQQKRIAENAILNCNDVELITIINPKNLIK